MDGHDGIAACQHVAAVNLISPPNTKASQSDKVHKFEIRDPLAQPGILEEVLMAECSGA